ncbi:transmembrane protein 272 isoform X2 [Hydra vulgaris]|uniref:Transmembrane protein 272 isoform X2 n=1 Tax=Hydra vulgaris TaxID=6087 RepID=A0ABM4D2L2_HYDVU
MQLGHAVGFPQTKQQKLFEKSFSELSCEIKENVTQDQSASLPPSYDSIFGQFKDTHSSSCSLECLKKVLGMFAGTFGCTLSLMLLLALPLSMIVIGTLYKDDCPIEPFIPIYLIVGGSFGIIKTIVIIIQRILYGEDSFSKDAVSDELPEKTPIAWMLIDSVLNLFLFTWFVAGNIWVYSKYKPYFVPPPHEPMNYCNKNLYMFSFWIITFSYIIMGLICVCTCCLGLCASCTAYFVTSSNNQRNESH